jgi:hypothetical protein
MSNFDWFYLSLWQVSGQLSKINFFGSALCTFRFVVLFPNPDRSSQRPYISGKWFLQAFSEKALIFW